MTSANTVKLQDSNCLTFPKHFDVRFAEHTLNIVKAVLNNLEAARSLWSKMNNRTIETEKTEKATAQGFLRKWKKGTQQVTFIPVNILYYNY